MKSKDEGCKDSSRRKLRIIRSIIMNEFIPRKDQIIYDMMHMTLQKWFICKMKLI